MAAHNELASDPDGARITARAGSARILIAFIALMGLLFLGGAVFLRYHPRTDELTSQINTRLGELDVNPASIELTSQKALRVRRAIAAGDFATATQITGDVVGRSRIQSWSYYPYEDFIAAVFAVTTPEFGNRLDEWVAKAGDDALPLLFRAQYYYDVGWTKRGHDFASKIAPERVTIFADDMGKALKDIDAALHLDPRNPYGFYLRLRILQGHGASPAFTAAFEEAIGKYPDYYPLYQIMLSTQQPRWRGNIPAMYAFVDKYVGAAPQFSPLKMLYLSLYRHLLSTGSVECTAYGGDADKATRCVAAFMQLNVLPSLKQNMLTALQLYDHTNKFEFGVEAKQIISDMVATPYGDAYSGAVLQLTATSMHSDTQLKEENPGQNDYIVDELVAQSWHRKGFPDNEVSKYREALTDARSAAFPSEEEKDVALALIYEQLSEAASQQHGYVDEIAYEKAAVLLGLRWDEHYICYGYYELKRYDDAVQACTKAIDDTDNTYAWYWRGEAYYSSKRPDQALPDLIKTADGEGYFAPYAAVIASMIYFDRNDDQAALDILNQYPFLYDPNRTAKSQVAVAYNNRCYAYMQLGVLSKALDDCTRSLEYGSIPDAFRKQQDLEKRLGLQDKGL